MAARDDTSTFGVGDVLTRIAGRPLVLTLTMSVVLAAALTLGLLWPDSYRATAVVTVAPITATPFDSTPIGQQVNIVTEREVVMSRAVAERAAAQLGGSPNASELLRSLQVTAPAGSQVMSITYTAATGDMAADGANAVARGYLEARAESAERVAQRLIENLDRRIDELAGSLIEEGGPTQVELGIQQQIAFLRDRQATLATVAINPGQVVSTAVPPEFPSSPGIVVFAAGGLAFGVLLAGLLALTFDRFDTKLRSPRRLASRANEVPIVVSSDPSSDEAYRRALLIIRRTMSMSPWLTASTNSGAAVLAVIGADERASGRGVATRLFRTATDTDLVCHLVSSDQLRAVGEDWGWPAADARSEWASAELVIIDALDIASPARKLALAGRCDLVAIVVDPLTSIPALEDLTASLQEAPVQLSLLFFDHRREGRAQSSAAWPVDESMYR